MHADRGVVAVLEASLVASVAPHLVQPDPRPACHARVLEGANSFQTADIRGSTFENHWLGGEIDYRQLPLRLWRGAHSGFRVSGSGFGLRVSGFGFRVTGYGFRIQSVGSRLEGLELKFKIHGLGFRV